MNNENNIVLGLMSGTSMDGLDLVLCNFKGEGAELSYEIIKAETIPYNEVWKKRLSEAHQMNALDFWQTHVDYGHLLSEKVLEFISGAKVKPTLIASHGHTIFHQPENKMTCQIGDGSVLAAKTNLNVICDFRSKDVALGGQGAPLVPIGDELLFGNWEACLNIGGIANISFKQDNKRKAFDVCPANMMFNFLSEKNGKSFDDNGEMGRKGRVNAVLLQTLNTIEFYNANHTKSLGREFVEREIIRRINMSRISVEDQLATCYEHCAYQIAAVIKKNEIKNVLVTGGGAHNQFLMERIKAHADINWHLPNKQTIDFKEAIIFAFLGWLRMNEKNNCLASVTGASRDSVGGAFYSGI